MKRFGFRRLNLGNTTGLKQEVLYFDHLYFDTKYYQKMSSLVSGLAAPSHLDDKDIAKFHASRFGADEADIDFLVNKGVLLPYESFSLFRETISFRKGRDPGDFYLGLPESFANLEPEELNRLQALLWTEIRATLDEQDNGFGEFVKPDGSAGHTVWTIEEAFAYADWATKTWTERTKLSALLKAAIDDSNLYLPLFGSVDLKSESLLLNERTMLKLALKTFPRPSEDVSWEQILEFRSDPNNSMNLTAFRRWAGKLVTAGMQQKEMEQEIEYQLHEYEKLMRLHRLKHEVGTLELVVVSTLELLENVVKLKWGSAARKLFEIRKQSVDFAIKKEEIPGKELAYLSDLRSRFM